MVERRLKQHRRYIFYRIYVAVIWLSVLIWGIFWLISAATNQEPSIIQIIGFCILFPTFGVAVFMLMSLFVFPFEFSIFGSFERRRFPDEQPILRIVGSRGMVGLWSTTTPFSSWYVYPSGFGVSIVGIGKIFIPTENIKYLKDTKVLGIFMGGRYKLLHNSPELYNPVRFSYSRLFKSLKSILPQEVTV